MKALYSYLDFVGSDGPLGAPVQLLTGIRDWLTKDDFSKRNFGVMIDSLEVSKVTGEHFQQFLLFNQMT